jgi:hypothetical protein
MTPTKNITEESKYVSEEKNVEEVKEEKKIVEEVKEETITIKKSEMDEIMDRLKRVEYASDKAHLANFDKKNTKEPGKTVKLASIDGKVVISWPDMINNLVEKTPSGGWFEDQKIHLNYEDGSSEVMEYVYFVRRRKSLIAEIITKTVKNQGSEDEAVILNVKTSDGREYSIDKKFTN